MRLDSLAPGARLGGFVIVRRLGAGGMGVVYEATDERLGRLVAIKVPSAEALTDPAARARFDREARAAAAVPHPNLVAVHAVADVGGWPYVALEHLPGGSLKELLRARGGLPWREACLLARDVALGLAALHAGGRVHRDVKPDNVLLDAAGRARVTDLGLVSDASKDGPPSSLTRTGEILGTAAYMAPEQADRAKDAGPAADLYALGCVLHELLTGTPPFRGAMFEVISKHMSAAPPSVRAVAVDAPPALERLVLDLLAKEPARRPAGAVEVARALDALLAARPRASRAPLALGLLLLVGLAGAAAVVARRPTPAAPAAPAAPAEPARSASAEPWPAPELAAPPPATEPPATATERSPPATEGAPVAATAPPASEPEPPDTAEPAPALYAALRRGLERSGPGVSTRLTAARGDQRFTHPKGVLSAAVGDGRLFVAGGETVTCMDGATGAVVWRRALRAAAHLALAGRSLLVGGADHLVVLDAATGLPSQRDVLTLEERGDDPRKRRNGIVSLALAQRRQRALVGTLHGQVLEVRLEGFVQRVLRPNGRPIPRVTLSEDGRWAFAGDRTGLVTRWDLDAPRLEPWSWQAVQVDPRGGDEQGIYALVVSPAGDELLVGDRHGRVTAWSAEGGRSLGLGDVGGQAALLALGPGSAVLAADATPKGRGKIALLDRGGAPPRELLALDGRGYKLYAGAFLDAGRAVTAGAERALRVWDLAAGVELPGGSRPVVSLRAVEGGLEVRRTDGAVERWSARLERISRRVERPDDPPTIETSQHVQQLALTAAFGPGPEVGVVARDQSLGLDLREADDLPTAIAFVAPGVLVIGTTRGLLLRVDILAP